MKNYKKRRIILLLIVIIYAAFLTACTRTEAEDEKDTKLIVAVSIVPEKTFVEAVCGDLVEVVTLIPPGNSPENYEPTPMQMEKFNKASVYFSIGVPTEEANILPNAGDLKVISLEGKVADVYEDRTFELGERDPHIWLSPKRVKVMVAAIANEMGTIDAANKEIYDKNAEAYMVQIDELDQEIKDALVGVQSKKFIVYHPAFGYIADDYGLEMFSLEEEGKEATPKHLQDMIDLAKKEKIKVIFYQDEIDSSQSEAFAEEIGGKTIQLSPLASDYINNLKNMADIIAEAMQ